jgi:cytosine/adenosine deaminase-related metal-dependent hydrolase
MAIKRRRRQIDPYLQTLYAALRMIANGVTSAIHANTVGGGPDYASEVDGALRAYADSGLRVMFSALWTAPSWSTRLRNRTPFWPVCQSNCGRPSAM